MVARSRGFAAGQCPHLHRAAAASRRLRFISAASATSMLLSSGHLHMGWTVRPRWCSLVSLLVALQQWFTRIALLPAFHQRAGDDC
jgi:hypothetical protein